MEVYAMAYTPRLKWQQTKPGREWLAMAGNHRLSIYCTAGNYTIVIDDGLSLAAYGLDTAIETAETEALASFKAAAAELEKEPAK